MIKPAAIGALNNQVRRYSYPNALCIYSLRTLSYPPVAAVRIRRDNDNTEQDFTPAQIINGSLESFCTGTDGRVAKWYDQSGNGNDAVQTTASKQPILVSSGTLLRDEGKPVIKPYDGNSDLILGVSALANFHGFFLVREDSVASIASLLLNGDANNEYVVTAQNGETSFVTYSNAGSPSYILNNVNVTSLWTTRDRIHDDLVNTSLLLLICNTSSWSQIKFGYSFSGGYSMMNMKEAIIYNGNYSWPSVYASINEYYKLY